MSSAHEMHPCPCPGCARESLHPDEYCATCIYEDCSREGAHC